VFLSSIVGAARQNGIRLQLIAGGAGAVRDFLLATATHPDALNVLLIDSEGPVEGTVSSVVARRGDWHADRARTIDDDQLHLMVQAMEAWFLADRDALADYYGQNFRANRLRGSERDVEAIPKDDAIKCLEEAARDTNKGKYHKTKHAPALLEKIDPAKVRAGAPHCERLFQTLTAAVSE
jgi:hypothetical protein